MSISQGQVSVNVQATPTKTIATGVQTGSAQGRINKSWSITSGTTLDKADEMYSATLTISGSGDTTLDLSNLSDAFGDTITLARIKAMIIVNTGTDDNIVVGNATNAWEGWISAAGTVTIPPSTATYESWFGFAVPDATAYAVTTDTADELKIANSSSSPVDVEIMLIGASA